MGMGLSSMDGKWTILATHDDHKGTTGRSAKKIITSSDGLTWEVAKKKKSPKPFTNSMVLMMKIINGMVSHTDGIDNLESLQGRVQ